MASASDTSMRGPQASQQHSGADPSPEKRQSQFELSVALTLTLWPALSLAVANHWGGPESADKRDWLAGAVVELFDTRPDTDVEDVETVLLQVLLDEFEVNVDDDSALEVAEQVVRLRGQCLAGDFAEAEALRERWQRGNKDGGAGGAKDAVRFQRVERGGDEDDTDWDSEETDEGEEEDDDDDDGDVDMEEAPRLVERSSRARPVPEVDEDGFTTVVSKKKKR